MTQSRRREAQPDRRDAALEMAGAGGRATDPAQGRDGAPDPRAVAAYVAALSNELLSLARTSDLPMLAYLIDMVRTEAEHQLLAEKKDAKR